MPVVKACRPAREKGLSSPDRVKGATKPEDRCFQVRIQGTVGARWQPTACGVLSDHKLIAAHRLLQGFLITDGRTQMSTIWEM